MKCAVLSCREAYTGCGVGAVPAFAVCDAHFADWLRLYRRLAMRSAPGRDVWPPCGVERVMADWLRTADAELRNGADATSTGNGAKMEPYATR